MKQLLLILNIALIVVFMSSCKKFLEEKPYSFLTPDNFPTSAAEADIALRGAYSILQGVEDNDYRMFDYSLAVMTSENSDVLGNFYLTTNSDRGASLFEHPFQAFYSGISSANNLIAGLGKLKVEDNPWIPEKIAEARAIRAYYYFWLVRLFSDVPLVLTPTTSGVFKGDRVAVPEIYKQIIEDLKFAEDKLPLHYFSAGDPADGRITRGGCKAIMVQVYAYMAGWRRTPDGQNVQGDATKWVLARDKALEVMNMSMYKLETSKGIFESAYGHLFSDVGMDVYNPEIIFDVPFNKNTSGNDDAATFPYLYGPGSADGGDYKRGGGQGGGIRPLLEWLRELEKDDERVKWNIADYNYEPQTWNRLRIEDSTQWAIGKYLKVPFGTTYPYYWGNYSHNFPLVRLADIKLLYAEAINEINGGPNADAIQQVKDIRNRAGLMDDSKIGRTKDAFMKTLMAERAIEFVGEGNRHFDLVRWNKYKEMMNKRRLSPWVLDYGGVDESFTNAPLPSRELTMNGWSQNK